MQRQWLAGAVLFLALVIASAGQNPQAPVPQVSPPTLRITVTLIQLDAVVTDGAGKHVAGLRPEEFEILQDGQPQKLSYFSYEPGSYKPGSYKPGSYKPGSYKPGAMPSVTAARIPPGPPPPVTARQIRRVIALVVDDLALTFTGIVRTRESLRQFVERQMETGDLVAIVRTAGGVAILEQFTTDKRVLMEAIDLLKWQFNGRTGLMPIHPVAQAVEAKGEERAGQGEPQLLDNGYPMQAMGALATIEQVIHGMKGLPGRKSVVFLSDGMRVDAGVNGAIDNVTDLANRSAVSLYTIDPAGLRDRARRRHRDQRIDAPNTVSLERFPTLPAEDDFELQQGLEALAVRTGGLFYHDRNDIAECIAQAADDQLGYYLLGYSPREGTFEKDASKAKFHRVVVRVRTPGLKVRWKSGFTGVQDELSMALPGAPKTRERQLMEALASPFAATGIKVRLTSFYNETKQSGPLVLSMLHFEATDLVFRHEPDGTWRALVDIVTSAYRGIKQPISQRQHQQEIRLPDEQYRKALKEGVLFYLSDPMKLPGTFLMRAVVRDTASELVGSASQYVQVPDTRKRQLAISGIILKLAPSDLVANPSAPAADQKDGKQETWSEGGPAVRRYRPGQAILCGYAVINPKMKGAAKEFQAGSQFRLFRNGKLLYTGLYTHALVKSPSDPTRLEYGGLLTLGTQLSPGEYLLQVVVTDEFADKKKSQVAQWVDFEIVAAPQASSRTPDG